TPAPVTFTDKDGTTEDTYTIPTATGIDYLLNGKVTPAGTYPGTGTITITVKARTGYILTPGSTTTWTTTFKTTEAAYTPPAKSPFRDVSTSQQFYKEMAWLADRGISTGWPDSTYRPLQPIKRDAMAAFIYRFDSAF
ncbi:S-layer homology domain-containing protein, partial [Arthrobacter sp. AET 35A]|uniref:S-layer homology domain-containing protein n=1 Tax=Arthrobacter sp. AET 35A TaxID=2292643 RepID=UPI001780FDE9